MTDHYPSRCLILYGLCLFVLALTVYAINFFFYSYPGNNYFPAGSLYIGLSLMLMLTGSTLLLGKKHYISRVLVEIIIFYLVMSAIAFATNAVQTTPFYPIDSYLLKYEKRLGISLADWMIWTNHHPWFKLFLGLCYDTLPYQLAFLPILVIIAGKFERMRQFYAALLITAIIGFSIYYFFPTVAPASTLNSPLFASEQFATGIKFNELHNYIQPSTMEGGMVAMPSFHTIWAWYCLTLMQDWLSAYILLFIINFGIILACILLGWHYPSDIIAAFVIIAIANYISQLCAKRT